VGGFVLSEGSTLRFRVGRYDRSKPLIIDPVLSYSTYIPGSATTGWGGAAVTAIAVDSSGSAYITGVGTAIPTTSGAFQLNNVAAHYGGNAYVMKLNLTGTVVVYATYLGGTGGHPIEPPPYGAGMAATGLLSIAAGMPT
jgi:hypothetical protein